MMDGLRLDIPRRLGEHVVAKRILVSWAVKLAGVMGVRSDPTAPLGSVGSTCGEEGA